MDTTDAMGSHDVHFLLHGESIAGTLTTHGGDGLRSWEIDFAIPTSVLSQVHPGDPLDLVVSHGGGRSEATSMIDTLTVGSRGEPGSRAGRR